MSSSSALDILVGKMAKSSVAIFACSSAHFGQCFIPQTLDFFVAFTIVHNARQLSTATATAAKFIFSTRFSVLHHSASASRLCWLRSSVRPFINDTAMCARMRNYITCTSCGSRIGARFSAGRVERAACKGLGSCLVLDLWASRKCRSACLSRAPLISPMWRDSARVILCA